MADTPKTSNPRAGRLPLRVVLRWLFLEPAKVPLLQAESRWRGIRLLLAVLLLAGVGLGLEQASGVREWGQWLGNEVGTLRVKSGRLGWDRPVEMPYVTRHEGWRVDFMPSGSTFPGKVGEGPETQGVWFSPEQVVLWVRTDDEGTVKPASVLFKDGKIGGIDWFRMEDMECGREQMVGRIMAGAIPSLIFSMLLVLGLQTLVYLAMFSAIPVFLRSPWGKRGFGAVFGFYSFLAVPPAVVAAVYSALELPGLDFVTIFIFGFLGYILLMAWMVRRSNPVKVDDAGGDDDF
jgi:hypothetical protein